MPLGAWNEGQDSHSSCRQVTLPRDLPATHRTRVSTVTGTQRSENTGNNCLEADTRNTHPTWRDSPCAGRIWGGRGWAILPGIQFRTIFGVNLKRF